MIRIQQVNSKHLQKLFFTFPITLYKESPYYVPFLLSDEKSTFNPKKNSAFEHFEVKAYLAFYGKEVVGRVAALFNKKSKSKTLRFSRFDVINDFSVTQKLFEEIIKWAKELQVEEIIGPLGFSNLDQMGLLVEGFDQMGTFITIYNYPYYKYHLEKLGFIKDKDWVEFKIITPKELDTRLERICDIAQKKGNYFLLKPKTKKEVLPYAYSMFEIYNTSFADFYQFTPLSEKQIKATIKQFFSVIRLDYLFIVVDNNKKAVGFGIMVPSLSEALRKNRGRLVPFGFIPILKALKNPTVLDMYLVAVDPNYLASGVTPLIMKEAIKRAIANGIEYAETGPELEDNKNIQAMWKSFETTQHKRRRAYKLTLS
ncbi:MAG: hypothetical protein WDA17_06360 [Sphaerochaetaceae bacterium]